MRQDIPSDIQQGYLLNLTCDMGVNKRQRYAILAFLKIDRQHGEPLSRLPNVPAFSFNIEIVAHND